MRTPENIQINVSVALDEPLEQAIARAIRQHACDGSCSRSIHGGLHIGLVRGGWALAGRGMVLASGWSDSKIDAIDQALDAVPIELRGVTMSIHYDPWSVKEADVDAINRHCSIETLEFPMTAARVAGRDDATLAIRRAAHHRPGDGVYRRVGS